MSRNFNSYVDKRKENGLNYKKKDVHDLMQGD